MAKVHYVQGRYRDAQGMCARVGLEELTRDDQPTYHLRLLAEAFVIKGSKTLGHAWDRNPHDASSQASSLTANHTTQTDRELELPSGPEQWVLIPAGGPKTGRRGPVGGAGRCLWSGMEGGLVTEILVREG